MWNILTSEYDTSSAAAQSLAKERIQKFRYDTNLPFEFYFKNLEALRKAASDVGCTVTDEDLWSRFLTSLNPDYLWIIQNHGSRTYADLKRNLIEYDMLVESSLPGQIRESFAKTVNALVTSRGTVGQTKGGGSEGKAPRWYHAPKGLEPARSITATSVTDEEDFVTTATIYGFSDYDFGGMTELSYPPPPPDPPALRMGIQENLALLSNEESGMSRVQSSSVSEISLLNGNSTMDVPTFIDSGASHWCIRDRSRFVTYTPARRVGWMAAEGLSGPFSIEGHGMAELTVPGFTYSFICDELAIPA
ncbi:hypothetical protein F5050DRAFT_1715451 [Lentinula boryana]|uniref:Uncharacterized protein n=1 Tax=Lentinula boryana TaxID=40481 RepID=A0ABQ8Q1B1_9AGAR|nr:hypothetical protein F5050DRAFT_1715451 [Lentinula boryana]